MISNLLKDKLQSISWYLRYSNEEAGLISDAYSGAWFIRSFPLDRLRPQISMMGFYDFDRL